MVEQRTFNPLVEGSSPSRLTIQNYLSDPPKKWYLLSVQHINQQLNREILRDVQRRVPAGQQSVQEAFTTDHQRPVYVKLNALLPDVFYWFDEFTVCAFREAVIDWAARSASNGRLTISCSAFGELQAQQRRLQHVAGKLAGIRVLTVGTPAPLPGKAPRLEVHHLDAGLAGYRLVLHEAHPGVLFISKELHTRCLGFFTTDADTINDVAEDIEAVVHGLARTVPAFDRLRALHETTQRVVRELDSYSRRVELAIARARRRPDLLTPARFDRIVRQSIAKLEQLKEIPRRALRSLGKSRR